MPNDGAGDHSIQEIKIKGNTMSNLEIRAINAYFKTAKAIGGSPIQPSKPVSVTHNGLDYVVLSNRHETLAVYRVRTIKGKKTLKGLKRWNSSVAAKS